MTLSAETTLDNNFDPAQRSALERAKEAAAAGDPGETVVALYESGFLTGLLRLLQRNWRALSLQDAEDVVAETVVGLFVAIRKGTHVDNLPGWMFKVANRLAYQRSESERLLETTEPNSDRATPSPNELPDEEYDHRLAIASASVARLLPRIEGLRVRSVLAYVLDAVRLGREDVPTREIADSLGLSDGNVRTALSRGRRKLLRLMLDENILDPSSRLIADLLPDAQDQD